MSMVHYEIMKHQDGEIMKHQDGVVMKHQDEGIMKHQDECYNLFWMDAFTGIILTTVCACNKSFVYRLRYSYVSHIFL